MSAITSVSQTPPQAAPVPTVKEAPSAQEQVKAAASSAQAEKGSATPSAQEQVRQAARAAQAEQHQEVPKSNVKSTQQAISEGRAEVAKYIAQMHKETTPAALHKIAQKGQEVAERMARDKVDLNKPVPPAARPAPQVEVRHQAPVESRPAPQVRVRHQAPVRVERHDAPVEARPAPQVQVRRQAPVESRPAPQVEVHRQAPVRVERHDAPVEARPTPRVEVHRQASAPRAESSAPAPHPERQSKRVDVHA